MIVLVNVSFIYLFLVRLLLYKNLPYPLHKYINIWIMVLTVLDHNKQKNKNFKCKINKVSLPQISSQSQNERFFFTFGPGSRRRKPAVPQRDKFFVGDQSQCSTGSCEFFLFCWMSGGIVEGDCGGFLMSCCNRPSKVGYTYIVQQVGSKLLLAHAYSYPCFFVDFLSPCCLCLQFLAFLNYNL